MMIGKRRLVSLPYLTVPYRIVLNGNLPYVTIRTLVGVFKVKKVDKK